MKSNRERVILHSDLNNFFASVETVLFPELKGKPLIVCGDPKERKGVVFAKNYEAKAFGIQTAETVYSALKKCPHVQMRPTRFKEYNRYSRMVQEIYARFTDRIEACSIDECALDVTESVKLFGNGEEIAEKIRLAVQAETGLTVSIGVSFNRVYAKLASEMKKPNAVTTIKRENYKEKVYPLPVEDLLSVGKNTAKTLSLYGIRKIGDLAEADEGLLQKLLGKRGGQLRVYARGEDDTPVRLYGEEEKAKSVGNSTTLPADTSDREEIKKLFFLLAESVADRMREGKVGKGDTVRIVVKDVYLREYTKQKKVFPTELSGDIAVAAYELFCESFSDGFFVHALGVTVCGFEGDSEQMRIGEWEEKMGYEKRLRAENAVAKIREKYGYKKMQRGVVLKGERVEDTEEK